MLVSVIIACFNVADFIEECVHSVMKQTYLNIEVICIDNNSIDDTANVLRKLKVEFPMLVVDLEAKPGANAARNKGLSLAKGSWVQFLDADDLLMPNKIEHQIELLNNFGRPDVSFIASASKKTLLNGKEIIDGEIKNNKYLAPFISKCGNTCANLWNKESLLKIGKWDENIISSQETELMLRLVLLNELVLIDKLPLTIIRERASGQISHRKPSEKWLQFVEIRVNYLKVLKEKSFVQYELNKRIFHDFLVLTLLMLAQYDLKTATKIYNDSIKSEWKTGGFFGISKVKYYLVKILGLRLYCKFTIK